MEFVEIERLADEVVGAQLERDFHILKLRIGGDHDDGASVAIFLELIENFQAAQVGQAHVEQNQVGRLMLSQLQARLARLRFDDLITPFFAFLAQRPAHQALVIHHQDFVGSHPE